MSEPPESADESDEVDFTPTLLLEYPLLTEKDYRPEDWPPNLRDSPPPAQAIDQEKDCHAAQPYNPETHPQYEPEEEQKNEEDEEKSHPRDDRKQGESGEDTAGVIASGSPSQWGMVQPVADVIVGGGGYYRDLLAHTRLPWMVDYHPWMTGFRANGTPPLFNCSSLRDIEVPYQHRDARDAYFIDMFFQKRYFKTPSRTRSSPKALAQSWAQFIDSMTINPSRWINALVERRTQYLKYSLDGMKIDIHQLSMASNSACCVQREHDCPMCYPDSPKTSMVARYQMDGAIPTALQLKLRDFDSRMISEEAMRRQEEAKEEMLNEGYYDDGYISQQERLRMAQNVIASQLDISNLKLRNAVLAKQIKTIKADNENLRTDIESLKDSVSYLSDAVRGSGIAQRRRRVNENIFS
jgi:FtsZ-binding cell division protein ZapB